MAIRINTNADNVSGAVTASIGSFSTSFVGEYTSPNEAAVDGALQRSLSGFNVSFKESPGFLHPRYMSFAIGGGTETEKWTQTASGSQTWKVAAHPIAFLNFIHPSDNTAGLPQAAVENLRVLNPNILLGEYKDSRELAGTSFSSYDWTTYSPTLTTDWTVTGTGGATDGDGIGREVDGTIEASFAFKVADIHPLADPYSVNSEGFYPHSWMMLERYKESFDPANNANYDMVFFDVGNWTKRFEELDQDWDRDGTAGSYDFDGVNGAHGPSTTTAKKVGYDAMQARNQLNYGKNLSVLWNAGSWFDWFDGARADTGPVILTKDEQPTELNSCTDGMLLENWGRIMGYNDDGTDRASGNFERGFKQLSRALEWIESDPITGTKLVGVDFTLTDTTTTGFAICRYIAACATIAGGWCSYLDKTNARGAALLDEYVATDIYSLNITQISSSNGWLGVPSGAHPMYGETFVQGTRGGIINQGVYCMEFTNGCVLVNPKGNGEKTINLPSPNPVGGALSGWVRFSGAQSPLVNDGSVEWAPEDFSASITMADATGLFLKRTTS